MLKVYQSQWNRHFVFLIYVYIYIYISWKHRNIFYLNYGGMHRCPTIFSKSDNITLPPQNSAMLWFHMMYLSSPIDPVTSSCTALGWFQYVFLGYIRSWIRPRFPNFLCNGLYNCTSGVFCLLSSIPQGIRIYDWRKMRLKQQFRRQKNWKRLRISAKLEPSETSGWYVPDGIYIYIYIYIYIRKSAHE